MFPRFFDPAVRAALAAAILALGLVSLAGCASHGSAIRPAVVIEQLPPEVSYHTFPPHRPPPHLMRMPLVEMGFCETEFGCQPRIDYQYPRWSASPVKATVRSVTLTISLKIRVWTMEGTGEDVLAHENTHRAISEHYYAAAAEIGRRAAGKLVGRQFSLPAKVSDDQADETMRPEFEKLLGEFMSETHERCSFAQERFDELTNHGRESITNTEAMKRALAAEAAHSAAVKGDRIPVGAGAADLSR